MSVILSINVLWLQARLGRGEFNSETTRVLHFVRNPEAEAQRQIAETRMSELDAENKVRYPLHTTMCLNLDSFSTLAIQSNLRSWLASWNVCKQWVKFSFPVCRRCGASCSRPRRSSSSRWQPTAARRPAWRRLWQRPRSPSPSAR